MIFFPRPVQTMEYSISVSTLFFCCFSYRLDTDFNRDSSTDTVFSSAVQGGNATQTAFRPRTVASAFTLQYYEGAKIGEPQASFTPTRPESTDYTRQPTARSARRIAHHATIAAAEASANFNLAAAVGAPADLTSAVHAPTAMASAVHAPAELTSTVRAPADLTYAVQVSAGLNTAVPTTV